MAIYTTFDATKPHVCYLVNMDTHARKRNRRCPVNRSDVGERNRTPESVTLIAQERFLLQLPAYALVSISTRSKSTANEEFEDPQRANDE